MSAFVCISDTEVILEPEVPTLSIIGGTRTISAMADILKIDNIPVILKEDLDSWATEFECSYTTPVYNSTPGTLKGESIEIMNLTTILYCMDMEVVKLNTTGMLTLTVNVPVEQSTPSGPNPDPTPMYMVMVSMSDPGQTIMSAL